MFNVINILLIVACALLGREVYKERKVNEEYRKSLQACEEQTVGDKILDKIKERRDQ